MIKEKDLCYRQNYKLLQVLEVKDKIIEKIISATKSGNVVEELDKEISLDVSGKENITRGIIEDIMRKDVKGNKERVKVIDEALAKFKF
jgi:hypothetical protein